MNGNDSDPISRTVRWSSDSKGGLINCLRNPGNPGMSLRTQEYSSLTPEELPVRAVPHGTNAKLAVVAHCAQHAPGRHTCPCSWRADAKRYRAMIDKWSFE
jgi:hypothetical protein